MVPRAGLNSMAKGQYQPKFILHPDSQTEQYLILIVILTELLGSYDLNKYIKCNQIERNKLV
jgi:hypothetical protein